MVKEVAFVESELENEYEIERNKPMPSKNHGYIQSRLNAVLNKYYFEKLNIFSELKIALPGVKPAVPDLSIYPKASINLLEDETEVTEPPLTAVEILSPTQAIEDITDKFFTIYFPAGVKSAWLVILTFRTIYVFTPDHQYTTFAGDTLHDPATDITLSLDEIFP